jgi:hypothetical protein
VVRRQGSPFSACARRNQQRGRLQANTTLGCISTPSRAASSPTIAAVGPEPVLAALLTLVGIGLTSAGVFVHLGPAIAPGALLTLVGGGWFGNCLARVLPDDLRGAKS